MTNLNFLCGILLNEEYLYITYYTVFNLDIRHIILLHCKSVIKKYLFRLIYPY